MTGEQEKALGRRIKRLREEYGMTLDQLESASGVSKGYLSQLERGERTNPGLDLVRRIAGGFDISVSELLGEPAVAVASYEAKVPKSLEDFLGREAAAGRPVPDEDVAMLLSIRHRGRRPHTAEAWSFLYYAIKRSV